MASAPAPAVTPRIAEETELWLVSAGWWASDGGWRHRNLGQAWWPTADAVQLQGEADAGGLEQIHRMLRGEE